MQKPHRIMVVDDDPDVPELIAELLFDRDCEVRSAASLDEAMRTLRVSGCDVLLCHLGTLRATPVQRQLEQLEPRPRLVVMSASWIDEGALGAESILRKPFTRARLIEAIAGR